MDTMPPRHAPHRSRAAPVAGRNDSGAVAVEFALAVPMIVLILLTLTQVFSWGMGYLAAQAAADHALQTTRVVGGTPDAGTADATALLDQFGGTFIVDGAVTVVRGPEVTRVTVSGSAHGLPLPIDVTVEAPTERYTTP